MRIMKSYGVHKVGRVISWIPKERQGSYITDINNIV